MRHRVRGKKLGRDTKHRKALWRNLMRQLVMHSAVETTETKGKELKSVADKIVSQAQHNSIASRRLLHRYFGKRDVVNALVDQVAPTFTDRKSGFTRVERVGKRAGDNALMVKVSWVVKPTVQVSLKNPDPQVHQAKSNQKKIAKPVIKPSKAVSSQTAPSKQADQKEVAKKKDKK